MSIITRILLSLMTACFAVTTPGAAAAPTSAADQARAWIEQKGWTQGLNADGSFVAIGTAPLAAGPDREASRAIAHQMACLAAKNKLAEFVAAQVKASLSSRVREGAANPLVHRVADGAAALSGDRETVSEAQFQEACWISARATLCGLVSKATFQTDQMLAVVMQCSALSVDTARAAWRGEAMPASAALESLETVSGADASRVRDRWGVQVMRDQEGRACLVAFGRSAVQEEPLAKDRAERRATELARLSLRLFLGELMDGQTTLQRAATRTELADGRSRYESVDVFRKHLESSSPPLAMERVQTLGPWALESTQPRVMVSALVLRGATSPAAAPASVAETRRTAVGVGRYDPTDGGDLHPAMRRARAIRAAVLDAKGQLAAQVRSWVKASAGTTMVEGSGTTAQLEVQNQIVRQALTNASIDQVEDLATGAAPEVRVRISTNASPNAPSSGGLPIFDDKEQGAIELAKLALQGLCAPGPLVALVKDAAAQPRLVVFFAGLGAGERGRDYARVTAATNAAAFQQEIVSGSTHYQASSDLPDALSPDGAKQAVRERLISQWLQEVKGIPHPSGLGKYETDGKGLWAYVTWDEPPKP